MRQGELSAQAGVSDLNAVAANRAADLALLTGERNVQRSQLQTAAIKGRQKANMAANGIDLSSGSALNTLTTTDLFGEIDANTLQADAIRSAWGHRITATNYTNDAIMKRAGASGINPDAAGTASLLGSAGTVAKGWYDYTKGSGGASSSGMSESTRTGRLPGTM